MISNPVKFPAMSRARAYFKCDYDWPEYNLKHKTFPITGLHFNEGRELTSISILTEEHGEIPDLRLDADKIVIQWYTGYKDKNGELIFEGDVIKLRDLYYVVLFMFNEFRLTCITPKVWSNPYLHSWAKECEVIEPIYENWAKWKEGIKLEIQRFLP